MRVDKEAEATQTRWDKLSDDIWWNYNRVRNEDEWKRIAVTERYCRSGRILEIGCGNGDLYTYLASWGHEVYGIDISEIAIRKATARCLELGLKGYFAVEDGKNIPLQDSCFDTVILPEVIEHLEDPVPILLEAKRLCHNGGEIIITVPNGNMIPDEDHKITFSHDTLKDLSLSYIGSNVSYFEGLPEQWIGVVVVVDKLKNDNIEEKETSKTIDNYFSEVIPEYIDFNDKKLTVIIPTYNRGVYLSQSIESVINQSYKNIELILVNDGSTDNTSEIAKNYKNLIYLEQKNKGKSAAVNNAMRVATGDFIWVMDDDDIANPRKAEMQVRQFVKYPEVGIIGTDMFVINEDNTSFVSMLRTPVCAQNEILLKMLETNLIYGSTAMIRRECFSKSGAFDENLKRSVDYDMYLRVVFNYPAKLLNFPTIMLRSHPGLRGSGEDSFDASQKKSIWQVNNQKIFEKIYQKMSLHQYCKIESFGKNEKLINITLLYSRIVGLLSNNCYENALKDYVLLNKELEKIKSQYYDISDFDKYIEYIIHIHGIVRKKISIKQLEILEYDKKFINNIIKTYLNSISRDFYNKASDNNYLMVIVKNKIIINYMFFRLIDKFKNIIFNNKN